MKCGVKTDHDREKKEGSDKKSEPRASKTHGGNLNYVSLSERRRNGVAIMVNKRVRTAVLGCNLKNDRMIFVHFQGKEMVTWDKIEGCEIILIGKEATEDR